MVSSRHRLASWNDFHQYQHLRQAASEKELILIGTSTQRRTLRWLLERRQVPLLIFKQNVHLKPQYRIKQGKVVMKERKLHCKVRFEPN